MTSNEAADLMGINRETLVNRAHHLGVKFQRIREVNWPTPEIWIAAARAEAKEANVSVRAVLAGSRLKHHCVPRWRAWRRVLTDNPRFSVLGLARVSGWDHSSILHGLTRLSAVESQKPVATIEAAE